MSNGLQNIEKNILFSTINKCGDLTPEQNYPSYDSETIAEYKCANLSVLDQEIANLQEQESVFIGFGKLKEDILAQKKIIADGKFKEQQKAAQDFASGVEKAAVLETLINNPKVDGKPFLALIKNIDVAQRTDGGDFFTALSKLCEGKKENPGCQLDREMVVNAFPEISSLLSRGIVSEETNDSWKKSFGIKKADGSDYSFAQMTEDMSSLIPKIRNQEMLSRSELLTLKNLPDFKNDTQDFPFLAEIKKFKDAKKPQYAQEKFTALATDLKGRLESEMKNMVALTQSKLVNENKASSACGALLADAGDKFETLADPCIDDLKTIADVSGNEQYKLMARSLGVAQNFYNKTITSYLNECNKPDLFQIAVKSEKLPACLEKLDAERSEVATKLQALVKLRKDLVESNDAKMKLRDYALEQMVAAKCSAMGTKVSSVGECSDEALGSMTPSVQSLIFDGMDIAIKYANMTSGSELSKVCDEEFTDITLREVKAAFCKKPEVVEEVAVVAKPVPAEKPKPIREIATQAPQRNYPQEAVANSLGYFFGAVSNALRTPVYNPLNQYAYGSPYSNPIFTMNQANSLYYNGTSSAKTYGFYSPTAGVPTYSSFTPYTSTWVNPKPVTFTSTYFAQ